MTKYLLLYSSGPQAVGDGGKKVGPVIGEEDLFLTEKSSLPVRFS